jgi:YVTN family beta-propeller protein
VIPVGRRPFGVTVDGEGRRAYTANVGSNHVTVIDIAARQVVGTIKVGKRLYAVALAGERGFVTDQYGGTVTVFDSASFRTLATLRVGDYPEGIAPSRDGRRIFVANWDSGTLTAIDVETLAVTGEVRVGEGPRAFGAFAR